MSKERQHSRLYRIIRWMEGFRKRHRKLLIGFALLLFFILVWPLNFLGMAPVWSWSVTVQVVDAETGTALPGVVAVADWPSVTGTLAGGPYHWGTIRRMETQTNDKGFFHLPGWIRIGFRNWISETDPKIHLYKAGYWPRTLKNNSNKFDEIILWPEPWISDWNGKVVKLEPMHWREWSREEWESKKKGRMAGGPSFEDCKWMEYPEYVVGKLRMAIRKIELFGQNEKRSLGWDEFFQAQEKECGIDVFKYLRKYGLTHEEWEACCANKQVTSVRDKVEMPPYSRFCRVSQRVGCRADMSSPPINQGHSKKE